MLRWFIISYFAPHRSAAPSAQVEGIASVVFTEMRDITHIKGCEGEVVQLLDTVFTSKARGQGQKWLLELKSGVTASRHMVSFETSFTGFKDYWFKIPHTHTHTRTFKEEAS